MAGAKERPFLHLLPEAYDNGAKGGTIFFSSEGCFGAS
jgi:hypothetical protein